MSLDTWRLFLAASLGLALDGVAAPRSRGSPFNQVCGGMFMAIGAALPLRG